MASKHSKPNDDADQQAEDATPIKKERVLHTRVSAEFEEGLKRTASELGTSVSGLVRHTLAHTFSSVKHAMAETGDPTQLRVGWVTPVQESSTSASPVLLGWQKLVTNLNAVCFQCNEVLNKGSEAAVAIYEGSGPRQFICTECLGKLGDK